MMEHPRGRVACHFVLSVKSSGSSIVQRRLAAAGSARLLRVSEHAENETLFWVKAASILGLPQYRMEHSEVPFDAATARRKLVRLLEDNLPSVPPVETERQIFDAFDALIGAGEGGLVEKTPHHLYQPSAIALMERYADRATDVDVRFVGLVRNPIATLYSSWRRFGVAPEREEPHWVRAYQTLLELAQRRPNQVMVVRYEDLVEGVTALDALLGGAPRAVAAADQGFNRNSLEKWRRDRRFGYRPSAEARRVARAFGYADDDLVNPHGRAWALRREPRAFAYKLFSRLPLAAQERMKAGVKRLIGRN